MQNFDLSVIIPFGLSNERSYIKDRVLEKSKFYKEIKGIEFIFVEGFSSHSCKDLKEQIEQDNHRYIKDETQKAFSQGRCRNLGAQNAKAEVLMFLDVDCYLSLESLNKILILIQIKALKSCPQNFFLIPYLFLSKEGSEFLLTKDYKLWDSLAQHDLIENHQKIVQTFAPVSSLVVINSQYFLELGGNDKNFVGHGYEDFDFLARLLVNSCDFEALPKNLAYDSRNWDFNAFEGFRAWFSLFGYETSFYGLYTLHFYHQAPNQNGYFDNKERNHQRFFDKLKFYEKELKKDSGRKKRLLTLKSFAYKPYIYELENKKMNFFIFNFLKIKLSHTKFYRLFRKFKSSPKLFFKDAKNPLLKFIMKKK